jgi:hypothetical protein
MDIAVPLYTQDVHKAIAHPVFEPRYNHIILTYYNPYMVSGALFPFRKVVKSPLGHLQQGPSPLTHANRTITKIFYHRTTSYT